MMDGEMPGKKFDGSWKLGPPRDQDWEQRNLIHNHLLQKNHSQVQPLLQRPSRVNKISFSRTALLPTAEEAILSQTTPRKKLADLQSKFSMSPDSRSASARSAKAVKKRASQGRKRKSSVVREQIQQHQVERHGVNSAAAELLPRPRLKPQSSLQGLRKLV